jgi:hypothetical protein
LQKKLRISKRKEKKNAKSPFLLIYILFEPSMRFLCDLMLSRLGKWLRAAGHDTDIVTTPIPDRQVVERALSNRRLLITRDRHFLKIKVVTSTLIYLKSNDFENCIQELNRSIYINWLYAPFSRCLACNSLLERPILEDLIAQIPLRIREEKTEFWYCPMCKHFYWEGSHTEHMRLQLTRWQEKANQFFSKD